MRVLCVAEKPSIAKAITQILSGGQSETRQSPHKYIKNYDFNYPQTNSFYTVTSVLGHLTHHDFPGEAYNWQCDPFILFDAPVVSHTRKDMKDVEKNLINEARKVDMLMIWTDCDREGEHIGSEVSRVCRRAKPNIAVKRARFSAIIAQQIHHAAQHPVNLDQAQADAVEARTILDLKVGAAFTRLQTKTLQTRVAQIANGQQGSVVSYGPCQFPTLGFVVARYNQVKAFIPETFWYIYLSLAGRNSSTSNDETHFTWKRGHLFDQDCAVVIYEEVLSNPTARVTKVTNKGTKKWKPLPLTTVELQKAASRFLKLSPKKALDLAEGLYQKGFLSYPRTETDQFDPKFDFMSLIGKQTADPDWGAFATNLEQGGFSVPRQGKNNDKAHPPIHPTAHAANLVGDEKKVYEFITRRFLACCSQDAEGWQTTVDIVCGGEEFSATGLVILQRNYLDVYPYDKWTGHVIPEFEEGEEFEPSVCELREGQTTKPNLLTEADLVTLMDKNGIGTDATIAQHIQTITDREYVLERMQGATKYLLPSTLGIGLIEGYDDIGFEKSLGKPQLRRETERNMVDVCEGTKTKNDMLAQAIDQYKEMFITARNQINKVVTSVRKYIGGDGEQGGGGGGGGGGNDGNGPPGGAARGGGQGRGRGRGTPRVGPPSRGQGGGRGSAHDRNPGSLHDSDHDLDGPPPPHSRTSQTGPPSSRQVGASSSTLQRSYTPTSKTSGRRTCRCDVPAVERTVIKGTKSKGKKYWACSKDACDFWEWSADLSLNTATSSSWQASAASSTIPTKRPYQQDIKSHIQNDVTRTCQCDVMAVRRTVSNGGQNHGRVFWVCSDNKCNFFEWDDEPPKASNKATHNSKFGSSESGNRVTGECFKCHQEGHWANACPNDNNSGTKRVRSFGSTADNDRPFGTCFNCDQEGHYSIACPNRVLESKPRATTVGSSGKCFTCGEEGHWTPACPNGGGSKQVSSTARGGSRGKSRGRSSSSTSTKTRGAKGKRGKTKSGYGAPDGF